MNSASIIHKVLNCFYTFQVSLLLVHCARMQHVVNEARKNKDSEFHVKKIIVGGSMVTKSLGRGIREIFNAESIANCYGLTETFGVLSISPVGHLTFDDCGFPVAGSKVKVCLKCLKWHTLYTYIFVWHRSKTALTIKCSL